MSFVLPQFPRLGVGLGLRGKHYDHLLSQSVRTQWLEATTENYLGLSTGSGGRPIRVLEKLRERFPIVLHGVSLSIGSLDPIDFNYLRLVKNLKNRIQPEFLSDHLCWTGIEGKNLHDLLPLPYTQETVKHLVERIDQVQSYLGSRVIFENVSSYLTFSHSEMTEWEFISEVSEKSGCGILLDLNNVYVNSVNHSFDPISFLNGIRAGAVTQFHLAGHSQSEGLLIDTHDQAISEPVWNLYQTALKSFGPVPTLIERDGNIPDYLEIEKEVIRAQFLQNSICQGKEGEDGREHEDTQSRVDSEITESGHFGLMSV